MRVYSGDSRYELSLIGRNLTDEIVAMGGGARPGACPRFDDPSNPDGARYLSTGPNSQDQVTYTNFGRSLMAQLWVRF